MSVGVQYMILVGQFCFWLLMYATLLQTEGFLIPPSGDGNGVRSRTSYLSSTASSASTKPKNTNVDVKPTGWFPTRIQDNVDYGAVVQSMYLRHIVLETIEMGQIALQLYLNNSQAMQDPFGEVAATMSACQASRNEGGKIGWVDRPLPTATETATSVIIPDDVIQHLFNNIQPKAGDVTVIQSNTTQQTHVVQVQELMVRHQRTTILDATTGTTLPIAGFSNQQRIGAHYGRNAVLPRPKLKGSGVTPVFPDLIDDDAEECTDQNNNRKTKKYYIQTAGCQMNVADSERLAGVLHHDLGMQSTSNANEADVVLFNTCSIRDHAEQKLYDALGPFAAKKRNAKTKSDFALIVTGCVAQQEGELLLRRVPEVDVVIGPQYIPFLKDVLDSVEWGHQVVATSPMLHQEQNNDFTKPVRGHSVRAWVNIIHGCNEHCTYCVVPATRGMEQSRTMENILQECLELAANGYKEVTLLGQNIDAYGRDMTPKRTFADLLTYLNHNLPADSIHRIRYVTSHPRYFSDRVIDAVANLDKVCECFHMPFQAGSNAVLKRMRRGYTFESYMRIINKIREQSPDASICGDVIVGFPGETHEDFLKTLELMEEVKFDNLNTFAYSPRPNTEAALFTDQVPEEIKSERLQMVQQLANKHGLERSERYLGRVVEVLVEDSNKRNPNQVMGRTRQGRQVYFDGKLDKLNGQLVDVKITEAGTWSLIGEMC